jgi:hypothetical protein
MGRGRRSWWRGGRGRSRRRSATCNRLATNCYDDLTDIPDHSLTKGNQRDDDEEADQADEQNVLDLRLTTTV